MWQPHAHQIVEVPLYEWLSAFRTQCLIACCVNMYGISTCDLEYYLPASCRSANALNFYPCQIIGPCMQ